MTDEGMKRRVTFSFLEEIKSVWRENYQGIEQTALAFSLNETFAPVLKNQIVSGFMLTSQSCAAM